MVSYRASSTPCMYLVPTHAWDVQRPVHFTSIVDEVVVVIVVVPDVYLNDRNRCQQPV